LDVVTDFGPGEATKTAVDIDEAETKPEPWGIHALPLDYAAIKEYIAKGQSIFKFEREGNCAFCGERQAPGKGLYAVCANDGCEGVGHLSCWSEHILSKEKQGADGAILPVHGQCPKCGGDVRWGDMMKELTLRIRGQKDIEKLFRKERRAKA
jgi:structure-specific endonuclease subunit SLX1